MVDIRSFFAAGNQGNPPKKRTKTDDSSTNKSKGKSAKEDPPVKVQKTESGATSKYFESKDEGGAKTPAQSPKKQKTTPKKPAQKDVAVKSPNQQPKKEAKSPKKEVKKESTSPKKSTPRRAAKKTNYINLDSDFEDSEEDFKPDGDDSADEDVMEVDDEEEEEEVAEPEEEEDDLVIEEVAPPPKAPRKRAPPKPKSESKSVPAAAGGEGIHADSILSEIPDAELPEAPEGDGKLNYFALKNKQSNVPPPSGAVELPEAAPNCLGGLTIVFTGVLPNLDRDASESVAKRYGARVTKSISKKTSLVVIGEEAGPSKVKKIKDFGIKAIDESGFLELLRRMPADGGDSADAQAAKRKREEEERAVLEEAMKEEEEEKKREKQREKERELAQKQAQKAKKDSTQKTDSVRPAPEPPREIPSSEKLWTVKYAPTNVSQLCGNKSQVQKLKNWLENWFANSKKDFKVAGPDGSGVFRAVLISGPPGIGKTSAAHLVAKELGFDILEKNASDVRSKSLLNADVKSVLNNTSVVGFFKHQKDTQHNVNERKFCLIMDEVDGMSSGDHGGAGALSAFCRITKMPMILICNDRSLPKMRTFDRVTFNLPFRRPTELEMRSRLLTIAHRERLKLEPSVVGNLVQATGNDIRQIINLMSTVSKTQKVIGHENSKEIAASWKKHVMLKPFDITSTLLGGPIFNPSSNSTLNDKLDLYFNDIDFAPLMIQENYLYTRPRVSSKEEHLQRVANAADSISLSDGVNSLIRSSEQQWSLLPFHGIMSTVRPASETNGAITSRINFASWLGKNSMTMKNQRLLQELQYHTRLRTSTSKTELRLEYVPVLRESLSQPLLKEGEDGIAQVIDTLDHYYLTKDDWDSIMDFGVGSKTGDVVTKAIPTKVKTAFTRKYNGMSHPVAIYKTGNSIGAASKQKVDYDDVVEDDTAKDEEADNDEDNGEIDAKKDKLIKKVAKKPKKTKKKEK